jgi:hypothetical protein
MFLGKLGLFANIRVIIARFPDVSWKAWIIFRYQGDIVVGRHAFFNFSLINT